jgi:hypothetical protein
MDFGQFDIYYEFNQNQFNKNTLSTGDKGLPLLLISCWSLRERDLAISTSIKVKFLFIANVYFGAKAKQEIQFVEQRFY